MEQPILKLGPVPEPVVINKVRLPDPTISRASAVPDPPQVRLGPVPEPVVINKVKLDPPTSG